MQVKVVSINQVKKESKIKAFVTIELYFDEGAALKLGDLKIVEGPTGLFVAMPSKSYQNQKGETIWTNSVDLNDTLHQAVSTKVLEVYNSGTGIEKAVLGVKKQFQKKEAFVNEVSPDSSKVFADTKPLTAGSKTKVTVPEEDNDIPF